MSAYDIQKLVEYRNISKWVKISTPSIYKKAIQLEEKGLIRGEIVKEGKMPEKVIYSLTDAGEAEFERLMFEISEKPINIFLDFNAVIVNLDSLPPEKQKSCIAEIEENISTLKSYLEYNIQKKENEIIDNLTTLLVYGLAIIIVMYPISDKIHFLIGGLIAIIGMLYMFFLLGKLVYDKINGEKKLKNYKMVTSLIWLVMFAIILSIGLINLYNYAKNEKNTEIKHYKYIEISQGLRDKIKSIDNYILEAEQNGYRVHILDAEAAIYMIPIDRYNKDYDMFLKGNIGKDGEQGQIEKIKQKNDNEIILVRKSNLKTNWQTPKEVVKYVRENLEKIGKINIFEIYK